MSQAPSSSAPARHPVDQVLPPGRLGILGLQHVLVMYTGCVTVPLVFGSAAKLDRSTVGLLINADLLVAGLITLIQALGIGKLLGVRLPVVAGATFTAVTPMILIAGEYGMQAVYGSMIAAGVFGLLVAVPFARAVRFFPPLVSGSVITVIGLSLIGVAAGLIAGLDPTAKDYAAPSHLALAGGIILFIILVSRFTRGFLAQVGVLLGLVGGTLVAVPMGLTDFSSVGQAGWLGVSSPFHFGAPQFPVAAVISMCVVMLVTFTESTADMLAVGEMTGRPLSKRDLARGLAADGVSGILGGIMNGFLDTVFAQNVGLVGMTKVRSRYVAAVAGGILVLLGLVPKLGEIVASLPEPVIGAAGLVMFATVTAVGIKTLRTVEFEGTNNLMVVAVSIGIGMLPVVAPSIYHAFPTWVQIIGGSAITSATLAAFLLNLLFNHTAGRGRSATAEPVSATEVAASGPT
ncbi:purine permease [Streptomyces sp. NBC_01724]|uniref:nucleobase:cation symporter-2 family protein n=1 Tax=Streptomyces TaxID=1883 RepID=UPI0028C44F40|nr:MULTISPECIES: nucleobase:cation symporter-2 family protein [unclassified Streptomyces]WTE55744.1 purine permease [Streptomyces sp. NBC_01620]WTE63811.1 purine permease [Streptomyces sp. NBC_01617]WTI91096.1 purine permease [Streptomyces sp. NBC_00724]WNO68719.1 nucleobase:cation symporter-2 family protein [Streptomyces sp. AM2-3-1]WSC73365.1 purine permease [Streptomyces sp. NBC_01760]